MDKKLKKLADFSSIHPKRLIGLKKVYGTHPHKPERFDNIGEYYYLPWDDRHPTITKVLYKTACYLGPAITATAIVGSAVALLAVGMPFPIAFASTFLIGTAELVTYGLTQGMIGPCPLGSIVLGITTISTITAVNAIEYVVTLPAKLTAKCILKHKLNKRKRILKLENGEEILANYNNAKNKNKELKYKQKLSLKQSKSIRQANQIIEKTNKLNQQNQEIERNL